MRYVVCDIKQSFEKDTNDEILFVTGYKLALKYKGGLWHHKKSDALVCYPIKKKEKPIDYENFSKVLPGSLFDVIYGVNSYTGKSKIERVELVPNSNKHFIDDVYL